MRCLTLAILGLIVALVCDAAPREAFAARACNEGRAVSATIAEITMQPDAWQGRCVKVKGVLSGRWLHADVDAFYRMTRDALDPTTGGLLLGLDGDLERVRPLREATVVGRVQDCETVSQILRSAADAGEIVFIRGYCHHYRGPYLRIVSVIEGPPARIERQLIRKGEDYGDIVPAAAEWAYRPFVEELSESFLAALRRGDKKALGKLMTPDPEAEPDEDTRAQVRWLLDARTSPFAPLRSALPGQRMIFVDRWFDEGEIAIDDQDSYRATVCFCLTADCGGRWPITARDADNLRSRPYACIKTGPYIVFRKGTFPIVEIPMAEAGLAEPSPARR